MILMKRNRFAFLFLVALAVALVVGAGLTACEKVEDEVRQGVEHVEQQVEDELKNGVEQVEQQVVTELKKLAWRHVSDGLEKLKDTIKSDEKKGVDWARSEVAKVRDGLQTILSKAEGGGLTGLEWLDEELQKLDEKLAEQKNADQVVTAIDEFMENLETKLGVSE